MLQRPKQEKDAKTKMQRATQRTQTPQSGSRVRYDYPKSGREHPDTTGIGKLKQAAPVETPRKIADPQAFAAALKIDVQDLFNLAKDYLTGRKPNGAQGFVLYFQYRAGKFLRKYGVTPPYLHALFVELTRKENGDGNRSMLPVLFKKLGVGGRGSGEGAQGQEKR